MTSIRALYGDENIIATEDEKDEYAANLTDFVMQFENDASDRNPDYRNAGLSMLLNAWSGKEILRSSKDYSYKAVGQWGIVDFFAGHLAGIVTKPSLIACIPNQDGNSLVLNAMRANKLPDQYESAMRNILLKHTLEREKFMTHGRCTASSAATVSAVGALKLIMDR